MRADQEIPEDFSNPELQDRSRPIITTCNEGMTASRGARTLKEMGFTDEKSGLGNQKRFIQLQANLRPFGRADLSVYLDWR